MSKINVRSFSNENEDGAPDLVGITTFSATSYFVPTRGTTAQRPSDHVEVGSLRYNYDIKNLEYYRGHTLGWSQFELINPDLGGGDGSNEGLGGRAVRAGGQTPSHTNVIDYFTISTLGDAQDFGDLSVSRFGIGAGASRTRGVFMGGAQPSRRNDIDFITIPSTGDALDFGDLLGSNASTGGSSSTRAFIMGGSTPATTNIIQYVTIASTGDAQDFGDVSTSGLESFRITTSSTRGVTAGGYVAPTFTNVMEYITIASTGNSQDFGDFSRYVYAPAHSGNSVRGIIAGGYTPSAQSDIDYYTIATLGNTVDFGGDLATASGSAMGGASDPTRACFFGLTTNSNVIQYIQIASTGIDGSDFGDLTGVCTNIGDLSNTHGGL